MNSFSTLQTGQHSSALPFSEYLSFVRIRRKENNNSMRNNIAQIDNSSTKISNSTMIRSILFYIFLNFDFDFDFDFDFCRNLAMMLLSVLFLKLVELLLKRHSFGFRLWSIQQSIAKSWCSKKVFVPLAFAYFAQSMVAHEAKTKNTQNDK